MLIKEVCRYSPNVDFSILEESAIFSAIQTGRSPGPRISSQLELLGYSGQAFQTDTHVVVIDHRGEVLFEIHNYH